MKPQWVLIPVLAVILGGCEFVGGIFGISFEPASRQADERQENSAPGAGEEGAGTAESEDVPNMFAEGAAAGDGSSELTDATTEIEVAERVAVQSVPISSNAVYSSATTSRLSASPVPVIGPAEEASPQGRAFADSFRATRDGFFATFESEFGPVALSGTQRFARRADLSTAGADYPMRLEEAYSGVTLAFGRYGVDYLLEFECVDTCPDEDGARAFAESLIVVGGGG